MNFEEKFNLMIETIEENLQSSDSEVCRIVACKVAEELRSMMDSFRFITNETMSKYVKRRRLIAIYNYKKDTDCSFEEAASEFGYNDVSTFSRTFKNTFGKSPAQVEGDINEKPLFLEAVLRETFDENEEVKENTVKEKFGISEEKYNIMVELINAKAFYGFSEGKLNLVYTISQKIGVPVIQAAEFVDEYFDTSDIRGYPLTSAFLYFISNKEEKFISDFSEDAEDLYKYISDDITNYPELIDGFKYMYNHEWDPITSFDTAKAMKKYGLTVEEADNGYWSLSSELQWNSEDETTEEAVRRYTIEEIKSGKMDRDIEAEKNANPVDDYDDLEFEDENYFDCSADDDEKYDPDNYYYSDDEEEEDEFIHVID